MPTPKKPVIKLILKDIRTGQTYLVKDLCTSYLTSYGKISKDDLNNNKKTIIESDKKRIFAKYKPTFCDFKENLLRAPQIMQDKDVGLIIAKTGINKTSTVVDAGAGSGALTLSLANICKHVTSYDTNKEHLDVVKKNAILTNLTNVTLKQGDVAKDLSETNLDLITLDLPRPWEVLTKASIALKQGAHLVVYLPNIIQIQTTLKELQNHKNLSLIEMTELIKRDWKVAPKQDTLRPEHTQNVHTGFLLFIRKF